MYMYLYIYVYMFICIGIYVYIYVKLITTITSKRQKIYVCAYVLVLRILHMYVLYMCCVIIDRSVHSCMINIF